MTRKTAHIVLATLGSYGDLHPFLALGIALKARGHRVTLATFSVYRERIESHGLEFARMRPEAPEQEVLNGHFMHPRKGPKRIFAEWLSPAIADSHADLLAACEGADLLVSQALALAAPMIAAQTGIPWISAILQPFAMFSAYDPPTMPPVPFIRTNTPFAIRMNQSIHRYAQRWTERWVAPVRQFRQAIGLKAGGHPIYEGQHAPDRVLALFSPLMGVAQADWPPQTLQTGAIPYVQDDATMPEGLQDFLDTGSAPLVFTLGSAACFHAGNFFPESLKAAAILGRRALFLTGERAASALPPQLPAWAARFDYAPYEKVFPQACAIIHSGGIGTCMQALRSGVPQLVVPFAHDQPDNAVRLRHMGAGMVLPIRRYRAARAVRLLAQMLKSSAFADRSDTLADMARAEQGTARACDAIEAVLRQREVVHA